jgi:uncharacterized membrane protein YoaK (UPF0700 family)
MQSRLAISLSWVAGYVNVVGWMVCGTAVSHVTGNVTHLGQGLVDVFSGDGWSGVAFFGFLTACFLVGAAGSGAMTEMARRQGKRSKYILPMAVEAILLGLFAIGMEVHRGRPASTPALYATAGVASAAMGLQNATITRISGAVVRTTHLTGVVTDLGLEGVQLLLWYRDKLRRNRAGRAGRLIALSRRHPTALRIALLGSILLSFLFGATVGAFTLATLPTYALLAPVLFLLYIVLVDWYTPIADVRELDVVGDAELRLAGLDLKSLLPPEVGIYRLSHHRRGALHHAPDFQAWAERIPRHWRVVVLAISPMTHLDNDAVADLIAAVNRLRGQGRRMLLCGVTPRQFKVLRDNGFFDLLDVQDACPDVEFAVARSLELVRSGT